MTKKITSPQDLKDLKAKALADIDLRTGPKDMRLTVHMGTCGIAAGARDVLLTLVAELRDASANNVTLQQTGCAGLCDQEPMLSLTDKSGSVYRYGKLDKKKVRRIVAEHVLRGVVVEEYLCKA
jgi:NADP-reducing hydrogenase subunit HndB